MQKGRRHRNRSGEERHTHDQTFCFGNIFQNYNTEAQGICLLTDPLAPHLEVTPGFEPGNEGFADPCLTTWLCHRTVSPLVSILYEAAFVKRETVFPAAFLLTASTDGGAERAPPRRTALALISHPAGCPAAPAALCRCCRCRGCVPPGSSGSCLRRWLCPCRRRGIRRSRTGHG